METEDTFDGTGQVVKHFSHKRQDVSSYDLSGNITYSMFADTGTVYYLHSTVLGGKTIAELNQNGVKTKGHVYSGGARIATVGGGGGVEIELTNPVTGAAIKTDVNGAYANREEPDPLGRELSTPPDPTIITDPIASTKLESPMYIEYTANWTGEMESGMRQYNSFVAERTAAYIYNATKREFLHALFDLARTGDNKYYDKMLKILAKNPNFEISINGNWVAGRDAANALTGAMSKLPGNAGLAQEPTGFEYGGNGGFSAPEKERLKNTWDKLKSEDCQNWFDRKLAEFGDPGNGSITRVMSLDAAMQMVSLNKYSTGLTAAQMGISQADRDEIAERYDKKWTSLNSANAVTNGTTVWLMPEAFKNDSIIPYNDRDLAGIVVHELFHVAGYGKSWEGRIKTLSKEIQTHCSKTTGVI